MRARRRLTASEEAKRNAKLTVSTGLYGVTFTKNSSESLKNMCIRLVRHPVKEKINVKGFPQYD